MPHPLRQLHRRKGWGIVCGSKRPSSPTHHRTHTKSTIPSTSHHNLSSKNAHRPNPYSKQRPRPLPHHLLLPPPPILGTPEARDTFLHILKQTSHRYKFEVLGFVVMPDHVHLLLTEPELKPLSTAIQILKQTFSRTRPEPEVWAAPLPRLQGLLRRKTHRKAKLHAPKPSPPRPRHRPLPLALEQLPPLHHKQRSLPLTDPPKPGCPTLSRTCERVGYRASRASAFRRWPTSGLEYNSQLLPISST